MRRFLVIALAVPALAAVPANATAAKFVTCKSADLRYPFQPGGPKTFGVFKLQTTGGSCTTAHAVAKGWMKSFEGALKKGNIKLPKTINGFKFKTLPSTAAQQYREKGTKGAVSVQFEYFVPNG